MLPELIFKGFDLDDRRKRELNQNVWRLKELCPCEAVVEVSVEKKLNFYFMSISIHHQEGEIAASGQGADLNKLSRDCFNKIHHALRNWKRGRFMGSTLADEAFLTNDNHMKYI